MITLPRPAIITRRALVTGAAALATVPHEVRAANAAGWNPSDKHADITVSDLLHYGTNVLMTNTATGAWRGARSVAIPSSGKFFAQMIVRNMETNDTNYNVWGVANGSAALNQYAGFDNNCYALHSYITLKNNSVLYTGSGGPPLTPTGYLSAFCVDRSTGTTRLFYRTRGAFAFAETDSGWRNFTGAVADPTVPTDGTDASALGTDLYFLGTSYYNGLRSIILNTGGWPWWQGIPKPAGYSGMDANDGFVMPSGSFTLSNLSAPSDITVTDNGMTATGSNPGVSVPALAYSSPFPAGTRTLHSFTWNKMTGTDIQAHALTGNGAPSDAAQWRYDGVTVNLGGVTWPTYRQGSTTYLDVDLTANTVRASTDGGSWTSTVSIAGLVGLATLAPAMYLNIISTPSATFNAGRLADPITVPSGARWLDAGSTRGGRGRVWR